MRAGFPSPADDYLGAPIDLSRASISDAAGVARQQKALVTKFEMRSPRYTTRLGEVPVVGRA